MKNYFSMWKNQNIIYMKPNVELIYYKVYENNRLVTSNSGSEGSYIALRQPNPSTTIVIEYYHDNALEREQYSLRNYYANRKRDFQAGDILVASDNVKSELTGYMGHTALVINESELIESPGSEPAIVKEPIQQFMDKHPVHAQFRSVNDDIGKNAARYATDYFEKYQYNLKEGLSKPSFSFNLSQSLDDPWDKIYCSKLIWICYHFGANYTFENDHLWFSPEDLYHQLIENKDFEMIYQHEDVKFLIDL
ncbi:hypothetical protein [Gracilibacillus kekensis]|uniref:Permuted papain-like amidase enzyme, YaeF/YiiX, C92 family n=1 Tax=Gracilibacillus kekensis TaxID=1027249 RepID=A0A1M7KX52_9BACI|nr:hypothetical protein [Gracilibacillus kekensis]SHM70146.1 hypothetical protein SAMN05216179_0871 [Gracilibacillus kekensis]